jgi:hypothetical protein
MPELDAALDKFVLNLTKHTNLKSIFMDVSPTPPALEQFQKMRLQTRVVLRAGGKEYSSSQTLLKKSKREQEEAAAASDPKRTRSVTGDQASDVAGQLEGDDARAETAAQEQRVEKSTPASTARTKGKATRSPVHTQAPSGAASADKVDKKTEAIVPQPDRAPAGHDDAPPAAKRQPTAAAKQPTSRAGSAATAAAAAALTPIEPVVKPAPTPVAAATPAAAVTNNGTSSSTPAAGPPPARAPASSAGAPIAAAATRMPPTIEKVDLGSRGVARFCPRASQLAVLCFREGRTLAFTCHHCRAPFTLESKPTMCVSQAFHVLHDEFAMYCERPQCARARCERCGLNDRLSAKTQFRALAANALMACEACRGRGTLKEQQTRFALAEYVAHCAACPHELVPCTRCSLTFPRGRLGEHQTTCSA